MEGLNEVPGEIRRRNPERKTRRAKIPFLSNMSHELGAPMDGIPGMTDLLPGKSLNEKQRHFTEAIRMSGQTLYRKSWMYGHGVMPARSVI